MLIVATGIPHIFTLRNVIERLFLAWLSMSEFDRVSLIISVSCGFKRLSEVPPSRVLLIRSSSGCRLIGVVTFFPCLFSGRSESQSFYCAKVVCSDIVMMSRGRFRKVALPMNVGKIFLPIGSCLSYGKSIVSHNPRLPLKPQTLECT